MKYSLSLSLCKFYSVNVCKALTLITLAGADGFESLEIMFEVFTALLAFAVMLFLVVCSGLVLLYYFQPVTLLYLFERWQSHQAGFKWRFISVGDFKFCYIERGHPSKESNSLLLLHGFSGNKTMWCQMTKAFPSSYHFIAVDLPGHGHTTRKFHDDFSLSSQAAKLHQFVQAIGLDRKAFHLVGISMGGHVAGVYAAKYTLLLKSLTLMCPAGVDAPNLSSFISNIRQGGKNVLLPETPEDFMMMVEQVVYKEIKFPYFMARLFNEQRRPLQDFFKKVLEDIAHPDQRFLLQSNLEKIGAPTLVLWGEKDQILDVSAVDVIKEKMPHWELIVLERCGHAINLERPWKSAKLMMQFMARQ